MYDKNNFFKDPGTLGGEGEVRREKAWNNRHPFPESQGWKLVPEPRARLRPQKLPSRPGLPGMVGKGDPWGVGREC